MRSFKMRTTVLLLTLLVAAVVPTKNALADTKVGCTVAGVTESEWSYSGSRYSHVVVTCSDSTTFYAGENHVYCGQMDLDNVKAWLSLAQAALLANKPIDIGYTYSGYPCGNNLISSVKLRAN